MQTNEGSSPLARGLLTRTMVAGSILGIIPARAGFTYRFPGTPQQAADHPRSRGVYRPVGVIGLALSGSSPLARGLRLRISARNSIQGIIPARAGFTLPDAPGIASERDHPRSRGVYGDAVMRPGPSLGSSPLARGLQYPTLPRRERDRIIPARAGFTSQSRSWCPRSRDHPRSRGVYASPTLMRRH